MRHIEPLRKLTNLLRAPVCSKHDSLASIIADLPLSLFQLEK
jgi:hypothetical protein